MTRPGDYLTTEDAAHRLRVTRKTVAGWCSNGHVEGAFKLPPGGPKSEWRIPAAWIEKHLREQAERTAPTTVPRDRIDVLMDAAMAKSA